MLKLATMVINRNDIFAQDIATRGHAVQFGAQTTAGGSDDGEKDESGAYGDSDDGESDESEVADDAEDNEDDEPAVGALLHPPLPWSVELL